MYPEKVSVHELEEHWQKVEALVVGESIEAIHLKQMPPWNAICSELDWEHHMVEGGYFSAKSHGYCGVYGPFNFTKSAGTRNGRYVAAGFWPRVPLSEGSIRKHKAV